MQKRSPLPAIPVLDVGPAFALDTLDRAPAHSAALLALATRYVPVRAVALGDSISRRWLARHDNPHLAEIEAVARRIGRPGAFFLNVNYEWGCTVGVKCCPAGGARLVRVLDWHTPGLGRYVVAARIAGEAGPWISLTWPGYTGVLQAMAPGRFAAALNQAPMAKPVGILPLDWAVNRGRVWRRPHRTPAHLLRQVFETAASYAEARARLIDTPICMPGIFSLAGISAHQTCIVERQEHSAHVIDAEAAAANHWQALGWRGRARGRESEARASAMAEAVPGLEDKDFSWLVPPVLNARTRLALIADAAAGRVIARGYEHDGPATETLAIDA